MFPRTPRNDGRGSANLNTQMVTIAACVVAIVTMISIAGGDGEGDLPDANPNLGFSYCEISYSDDGRIRTSPSLYGNSMITIHPEISGDIDPDSGLYEASATAMLVVNDMNDGPIALRVYLDDRSAVFDVISVRCPGGISYSFADISYDDIARKAFSIGNVPTGTYYVNFGLLVEDNDDITFNLACMNM